MSEAGANLGELGQLMQLVAFILGFADQLYTNRHCVIVVNRLVATATTITATAVTTAVAI
jgi:hypothetical protein